MSTLDLSVTHSHVHFPSASFPSSLFSPPFHLGGFYYVSNTGLQRPQLASTTDLSSLLPSSTVLPIILQTPEVVLRSNLHFPHSACLLYMSPALFNTHTHTINTWSYCILIIVQGCSMVRPQPLHYESYDYHWCRAAFLSLATSTAAMLESNRMAASTHLQEWQQKGHCDNQYTALPSPGSASVRHTNQPAALVGGRRRLVSDLWVTLTISILVMTSPSECSSSPSPLKSPDSLFLVSALVSLV